MTYNVINSGSRGNAVLYHDCILIDVGVPFTWIKEHVEKVQLVLLTHEHGDHINISTLKKLQKLKPSLRVGCGQWMLRHLTGVKNITVYDLDSWYEYGNFLISPVRLFHDVLNCGYRIFKKRNDDTYHKIIHVTDTAHMQGVSAVNYDVYAIEHNYCEEKIMQNISEDVASGRYSYRKGAMNSHLSEQQAIEWLFNNNLNDSEVVRLHESKENL